MRVEDMSDKELYDALQTSGLVDKMLSSEDWKILREAGDRIVARAINDFMETPASDTLRIMELQVILRKYKKGIFQEVEFMKQDSDRLFEEAKERGFFEEWREKIFG